MGTDPQDSPSFTRRQVRVIGPALVDFAYQCAKNDDEFAFREYLHQLRLFEGDEAFEKGLDWYRDVARVYRGRRRH